MRCPQCKRRIGFNQRGNWCPRCGAWLLPRPPSEHELEHRRLGSGRDDWLNDFPWIGGTPGGRALAFTTVWIVALVGLALLTLYSFVTLHILRAVLLIFVTAMVGILPRLFLEGSRI